MAKTYDIAIGTVKDEIRLRLDDKVTGEMILEDEEIDALVARLGQVEATARCAESIALHFTKKAEDMSDGDSKTKYNDRSKYYLRVADMVRKNNKAQTSSTAAVGQIEKPDMSKMRTD